MVEADKRDQHRIEVDLPRTRREIDESESISAEFMLRPLGAYFAAFWHL